MKAVTWHGRRDVRVDEVPDPQIQEPTDAIIKVTTTAICGSDLHLYEVMGPFMSEGDILGHEPMGIVEEVGSAVTDIAAGDRVVIPVQHLLRRLLHVRHRTSEPVRNHPGPGPGIGRGAAGLHQALRQVPGGQAEYLRVPHADYGPIKVPEGPSDERFLFLSDVLPTAWQGVEYADVPKGGSLVVLGLGPIGEMACRVALQRGIEKVIGVDLVPERLARAAGRGVTTIDLNDVDDIGDAIREMTEGRGADSVIDAVGMEAHGSGVGKLAHDATSLLPDKVAEKFMEKGGVDRLGALLSAIDIVRRGGTISLSGVYGGMADPLPMMTMFDKQIQFRMGQANVKNWVDDILPLLNDDDPLGVEQFATHRLPLPDAPQAYETFQKKQDGAIKILLKP